ncbi:hypothetical protein VVAX_03039 [Variovorax paradoxus]|jgi:hypothetical protein|uniref:Uncharacterized protein n=1 Tax=Variovorax paradoxus TaxID=34073 RepID=A0A679J8X0_VARPD|nr:hypothetical protein VVAX_03039 [Variovorax paradoxus]
MSGLTSWPSPFGTGQGGAQVAPGDMWRIVRQQSPSRARFTEAGREAGIR